MIRHFLRGVLYGLAIGSIIALAFSHLILTPDAGAATVTATREGLVGHKTATGHVIRHGDVFVALPSVKALHRTVRVSYGRRSITCPVLDVGPHHTNDPYWVKGTVPRAQTTRRNHAGIDISDGAWKALGITRKIGTVRITWKFE